MALRTRAIGTNRLVDRCDSKALAFARGQKQNCLITGADNAAINSSRR